MSEMYVSEIKKLIANNICNKEYTKMEFVEIKNCK